MVATATRPHKATKSPEDRAAQRQEMIARLERGFTEAQQSEQFKAYLQFCSRFHRYSPNNTMLIYLQRPEASHVAGFHTWLGLKRAVRKGEKGIAILAPVPYRRTTETGDGDEEVIEGIGFRTVYVFDIAQTDGEAIPSPVTELTGVDALGLYDKLVSVATEQGLTVSRAGDIRTAANGYYAHDKRLIWVKPNAAPAMAAKTLAHELGHHFADHRTNGHCREEAETIAESVAYIVNAHFGIDTSDYSFGYLAGWSDLDTFRAKVKEIQTAAARIIDALEATK